MHDGMRSAQVWRGGSHDRVELGADIMQGIGNCYLSLEQWEEAVQVNPLLGSGFRSQGLVLQGYVSRLMTRQ